MLLPESAIYLEKQTEVPQVCSLLELLVPTRCSNNSEGIITQ